MAIVKRLLVKDATETTTAEIDSSGNVTATSFTGDGSGLTNITAAQVGALPTTGGTISGTLTLNGVVTSDDGSLSFSGLDSVIFDDTQIKSLAEPTLSTDAATKGYVDTHISGVRTLLVSGYYDSGMGSNTGAMSVSSLSNFDEIVLYMHGDIDGDTIIEVVTVKTDLFNRNYTTLPSLYAPSYFVRFIYEKTSTTSITVYWVVNGTPEIYDASFDIYGVTY